MPKVRSLRLSDTQRQELVRLRDTAAQPHLRERAAALLKVAAGTPAASVARVGLLRQRDPDTVYDWLNRFEAVGIDGLRIRPGRGRKPAFSPRYPTNAAAKQALLHGVRREPRAFGIAGTRWTLARIHAVCDFLRPTTPGGLAKLLDRLGISYKRGREHLQSPDPDYRAKLDAAADLVDRGRTAAGRIVTLYLDEFTFYRQPTLAPAWEARGRHQPLAERSYRANTPTRILAALAVGDGRVLYRRRRQITCEHLVAFYQQVRATYPAAERIYVLQDNWPVHVHPDVLVALEPQEQPWPW